MQREFVWGVCDKTGSCDSYFGFFKTHEAAIKELNTQASRLKEDLGMISITIEGEKAYFNQKPVITIHQYLLR